VHDVAIKPLRVRSQEAARQPWSRSLMGTVCQVRGLLGGFQHLNPPTTVTGGWGAREGRGFAPRQLERRKTQTEKAKRSRPKGAQGSGRTSEGKKALIGRQLAKELAKGPH